MKSRIVYTVDGKDYDDVSEARAAEEEIERQKVEDYNPTKEIDQWEKHGFKQSFPENGPRFLRVEDKYTTEIYLINTPIDLGRISLEYVKVGLNDGWYTNEDEKLATEIVRRLAGKAAFQFLVSRAGGEYEDFELCEFSTL